MKNNSVLFEDLDAIAGYGLPVEKYRNRVFLITGATGLIGSLLVRTLMHLDRKYGLGLHIIAVIRNREKAMQIYGSEAESSETLSFLEWDLTEALPHDPGPIDYIIHTASVTASKTMVEHPVESIRTAVCGTMAVMELARDRQAAGTVYISSMEVYGTMPEGNTLATEDRLGTIDLSAVRSCYPEGKRMCECLCNAYAHEYKLRVCTVRLAQTFGAGVLPGDRRVFAQFARSAMEGRNIVLHTKGLTEGNYVYTADAVAAILLVLTEGEAGSAYNAANEKNHMRVLDMAQLVADVIAEGRIRVVIDIPEDPDEMGYAPDVRLKLSSARLRELGWQPHTDLAEAYRRMIGYMRETEKPDN